MNRQKDSRFLACGARVVRNATLLLLVSAGAFVGCKQGRGDRCQQDSDCSSGLVCGASCSLANQSCTCEPIVGVGTGGTTVVSTGGATGSMTGSGGAGGTPDQGQGGGAGGSGGEAGGTSGDAGGAGGQGGGGGTAAGGDNGAGGSAVGGGGVTPAGGAGGA